MGASCRLDSVGVGATHFFVKLLQKLGALFGAQLALQFFEGQSHDVVVVRSGVPGILGDVEPELVHELNVLGAQAWGMRPQRILANGSVGSADFQAQARTGAYKVAKVEGPKFTLDVAHPGQPADDLTVSMTDEKTMRWDIGQGREIVLVRAVQLP